MSTSTGPVNVMSATGTPLSLTYELEVVQQPDRARMCGFGDKDRRPITPPPCVRLVIRDARTNQEIDPAEIDPQHFVLSVDIWDQTGQTPANEVKHSNTSPSVSISMASVTSYPPAPEPANMAGGMGMNSYGQQIQGQRYGMPGYAGNPAYNYGTPYGGYQNNNYATVQPGTFQRNLIGSLSVSASWLEDTEGKGSYWFVLQDLSVRTEGIFRLRLSFMNLNVSSPNCGSVPGTTSPSRVPILAHTFTETFQVYSAKRFPGVKESTELSKRFANQGVKIPIRKDVATGGKKRGSDDGSGDEA